MHGRNGVGYLEEKVPVISSLTTHSGIHQSLDLTNKQGVVLEEKSSIIGRLAPPFILLSLIATNPLSSREAQSALPES